MKTCPYCLLKTKNLQCNYLSRRGLYCDTCHSAYLNPDKNPQYIQIMHERRKLAKHEAFIKVGIKRCSVCKCYKPFDSLIKDKNKIGGVTGRCKSCDKIIKQKYKEKYGIETLKKYHDNYAKIYSKTEKGKMVAKKMARKSCDTLSDSYIKSIIRANFRDAGLSAKGLKVPKQTIILKRAMVDFKRAIKESKHETI